MRQLYCPTFTSPKRLYSETVDPIIIPTSITTNNQTSFINIIDTPGLNEHKLNEPARSDDTILKLMSLFMKKEIVQLHCIVFVHKAGDITDEDIRVFKKYLEYLPKECEVISMFITTHADTLSEDEIQLHRMQWQSDPRLKFMKDYCKMGYHFSAAIPDRYKNDPDPFITEIREYRQNILHQILSTTRNVEIIKIKDVISALDSDITKMIVAQNKKGGCYLL